MQRKSYQKFILFYLVFSLTINSFAGNYYFVQFKNKKNTSYTISNPSAYLSDKAIARRQFYNIAIDSTDLPVNTTYLNAIKLTGVSLHSVSKWMNGATILVTDSTIIQEIRDLSFVERVEHTGIQETAMESAQKIKSYSSIDYGTALKQTDMINGRKLHDLGYTGKGINIGVMDAGFLMADVNQAFDSMRIQGRYLGSKNIAEPGESVFLDDAHGSNVLAIMGGITNGSYLGTAPHANYLLIETEYVPTEYPVEVDNWVSGIEYADSMGMDVINSSLGYTYFDDPKFDFTYQDMNGKVSRASRAATMAALKGMIVCVSAGNSGTSVWKYLGSPSDADGILAVGSVLSDSTISPFSSYGPSADNRIKPDVCAQGTSTAYINTVGNATTGNGTSYSSPVIAGMMACFLQFTRKNFPNKSISETIHAVKASAHLFENPNDRFGNGIPDFMKAKDIHTTFVSNIIQDKNESFFYYDKTSNSIQLKPNTETPENIEILQISNLQGQTILYIQNIIKSTQIQVDELPKGIYIINALAGERKLKQKLIIY